MSTRAVVGVNWGDEGKGRMVDLLSQDSDIVIRYQGGSNAGHTVVNEYGKFALNLVPSGIFRSNVVNILGGGAVVDLEHLCGELDRIREKGVKITPDNFKISNRAVIVFPYHRELDILEEQRLADKKYGSTRRGIAPVYSDKYQKKAILVGELLEPDEFKSHLKDVLEWKNLTIKNVYGAEEFKLEDMYDWAMKFGGILKDYICDTTAYLSNAYRNGKKIMFEAQLGTLRDIDFGIYPYTTSSNPIAAYAPIGAGIPFAKVDEVIGVAKAYSTCVGEGPFTAEWFGDEAEALRKAGAEYGAATGRPRRVGPFDIPASRYGTLMQGTTAIALTKLDILSYMDKVPVCTHYMVEGKKTQEFPFPTKLKDAKPVFEYLPGWKTDISKIRNYEDLPEQARAYIEYIEKEIRCPIKYVSVGAERDAIIIRN